MFSHNMDSLGRGELSPYFRPIFRGCHQGPIANTESVFNPVLGLCFGPAYLLFKPHQLFIALSRRMTMKKKLRENEAKVDGAWSRPISKPRRDRKLKFNYYFYYY